MKKIRIGCGAGGCTYERMEPALELLHKGNLDYIVFECLAERTIANAQKEKLHVPSKGYNPMLEERMRAVLPVALRNGVKIISNMGAANTPCAVEKILEIAGGLSLSGFKAAMVEGDDILPDIGAYLDTPLYGKTQKLLELGGTIVAANAYLSGDPIKEALGNGANVVITGRVADPALFVGPLKHEFGWTASDREKLGQALLLGHLLECAGQLTGGYYADPGFKDVENLHLLGFPIAEIDEEGTLLITKPEGSGGLVSVDVCKEQLLYEIGDPAHYITPDGIADFSQVRFEQVGKDRVLARGAVMLGEPSDYKVNIGYQDCFIAEAGISYGGSNALQRARLAAEIVEKRLQLLHVPIEELRVDYIGYNSLYKNSISSMLSQGTDHEIRLRIAVRTKTREAAVKAVREVECLYTNGPAGGGGISSQVSEVVSIDNILVPRSSVRHRITYFEE